MAKHRFEDKEVAKNHFLKIAKGIWGDLYDYSKFVYTYSKDAGEIVCKEHGSFFKSPNKHTRKDSPQGCPKCSFAYKQTNSLTSEQMLERFKLVHNDRYLYNLPKGKIRMKDKVEIICKEHGSFLQTPDAHLNGKNCSKCSGGVIKGYDDFMSELPKENFDIYDYSSVKNFDGYSTILTIYCKRCTSFFKQRARHHIKGGGCQSCNKTRGWKRTQWIDWCKSRKYESVKVYVIKIFNDDELFYKVGITNNINKRFDNSYKMPYNFVILDYVETSDFEFSYDLENRIKSLVRPFSYKPKISFGGETECFTGVILDSVIDEIKKFKEII